MGPEKQFIMNRSSTPNFDRWLTKQVGSWFLHHSPELPTAAVRVQGEACLLLGWPIRASVKRPSRREFIEAAELEDLQVRLLDKLAGRWLLVTPRSIQPDPLGSYSVVYSRELEAIASSSVLFSDDELVEDAVLNSTLGLPQRDRWYPFTLTPYRNLRRLLPNHILDLATLKARRIQSPKADLTDEEAAQVVASDIRDMVHNVALSWPIVAGLTAGHESRIIAAALHNLPNVELITVGRHLAQDSVTAHAIAERFGFSHRLIPQIRDSDVEAQWFATVGRCVAGAAMKNARTKRGFPSHAAFIKGIGGEVGRAYYYRDGDKKHQRGRPPELIRRMRLPRNARLLNAAEEWLSTVESVDWFDLLDLAYIENRIGAWASPQLHGDIRPAVTTFAFNQASTIRALRAFSYQAKISDCTSAMVISRIAPEFLSIPLNEPLAKWQLFRHAIGGAKTIARKRVAGTRWLA